MGGLVCLTLTSYLNLKPSRKCHLLQWYTQIQRQVHRHKHIHSLLSKFSVSLYSTMWQPTAGLFSKCFRFKSSQMDFYKVRRFRAIVSIKVWCNCCQYETLSSAQTVLLLKAYSLNFILKIYFCGQGRQVCHWMLIITCVYKEYATILVKAIWQNKRKS